MKTFKAHAGEKISRFGERKVSIVVNANINVIIIATVEDKVSFGIHKFLLDIQAARETYLLFPLLLDLELLWLVEPFQLRPQSAASTCRPP